MSRDRRGRFTAERTTTETTTKSVTERITVEPPPSPVPVLAGDPAPVFGHLLRHPPGGARWAHPGFIADMAARAAEQAQAGFVVPYDDTAPVPVVRVPVERVPYPQLEPGTLASEFADTFTSEFTEDDREQLALALDHGGSV